LVWGRVAVVIDVLSSGFRDAGPTGATFVEGDVSRLAGEVLDPTFDGVTHFAARSLVGESVARPGEYWQGNVTTSLALLDAMRAAGVDNLVFSSTAATYGEPEQVPITEDMPARPTNTYGATKLAIAHAISSYALADGVAATGLRYFNVAVAYGSAAENREVETHLIFLVLKLALGHRDHSKVF